MEKKKQIEYNELKTLISSSNGKNRFYKALFIIYIYKKLCSRSIYNDNEIIFSSDNCYTTLFEMRKKIEQFINNEDDNLNYLLDSCMNTMDINNIELDNLLKVCNNLEPDLIKYVIENEFAEKGFFKRDNSPFMLSFYNFVGRLLGIYTINGSNPFFSSIGYLNYALIDFLNNKYKGLKFTFYNDAQDVSLYGKIKLYLNKINYNDLNTSILSANEKVIDYCFLTIPSIMNIEKKENKNFYFEWNYINAMLNVLSSEGRCVALLPDSLLKTVKCINEREKLVEGNFIEGIVCLPNNLEFMNGLSWSIVVFSNKKENNNIIKYVDASKMLSSNNELEVDEILKDYFGFYYPVTKENLRMDNYSLTARYINEININTKESCPFGQFTKKIYRGAQNIETFSEQINNDYKRVKLFSVGDIKNTIIKPAELPEKFVNIKKYEKFFVQNDDIILSAKSTTIKVGIVKIDKLVDVLPIDNVIVIRCDNKLINPSYLCAFLNSKVGNIMLENIQTGRTIKSINASALYELMIPVESFEIQAKIGLQFEETSIHIINLVNEIRKEQELQKDLFSNLLKKDEFK